MFWYPHPGARLGPCLTFPVTMWLTEYRGYISTNLTDSFLVKVNGVN